MLMNQKCQIVAVFLLVGVTVASVVKQSGDMSINEIVATVKSTNLAVPINISCKSNVKTNQRASWVGLGFDLNVPYIERIANGSADEKSYTVSDLQQLVNNEDCFQPGIFDKNLIWEPLLKPNANGYQGEYAFQMTCPGTDIAEGYFTDILSQYNTSEVRSTLIKVKPSGEIEYCFGMNGGTCATWDGPIGTTNRPAGEYPAGTLDIWLGNINCTDQVQGVKKRDDFKYNDQQDFYFLNAFFGSGRIVFKNPSYQSVTLSSGNTFKVYSQAEALVPYLQNYRKFVISFEYNTPSGGADPDIIKWTIKDENGTEYVFDKTVMRYNANPANLNERTFESVNSHYTNGQLLRLIYNDLPQSEYPMDERPGYPNKSYIMRWYLTMIKGSNYSEIGGVRKGDWIEFEYPPESSTFQTQKDMYHSLLDNKYQRQYWPLVGVSKVRSSTSPDNFITAIYSASDFCFKPVYPYKVRSPFEEIEFQKSAAIDYTANGGQQLDAIVKRIKVDGTYQLNHKVRFFYDSKGHAIGHPYSKTSAKGLTMLREIAIEDRNGTLRPHMKFFYVSNPAFQRTGVPYAGYFTHDFFGYYCSLPTTDLKNPFLNNDGHSTIDAAAWSIRRVVYGDGKIVEYEYEPNEIGAFNTGEKMPLIHGPGVRVHKEKVYSGMGDSLVTIYKYGKGFTSYNMALASFLKEAPPASYLGEIYLLLNYGQLWQNMHNVLLLSGNGVLYDQCEAHIATGYERTHFLSPDDFLREYGGDRTISLADDKYGKSSKGNYRGAVKSDAIYKANTAEKPAFSRIFAYEIKHDFQSYIMPYLDIKANFTACKNIDLGPPSQVGDPPSFPDEDIRDLQDTTYIGYLRNVNIFEVRDDVSATEEYTYDVVSGSVKKAKKCNSDQSCVESEKIFAHEISNYSWMTAKNMLMQVAGTKIWGQRPTRNNGTPEITGGGANTWSQANGGYSDQGYVWNVNMGQDGFPSTAYSAFDYTTKSGTNWQRKSKAVKLDDFQRLLEAEGTTAKNYQSIIYRQDMGMPMAEIANGRYDNSAIFTCDYDLNDLSNSTYFDYPNRWERGLVAGSGHLSEVSSDKPHFGLKSIHVKNSYGPTRNVSIDRTKKYVFSAWVYPVSTTKYIRFAVEVRDQDDVTQASKDFVKENPVVNQWQLVEHQFGIDDVATSKIDGTGDYFRIWVGNGEDETYYDGLGYTRPEFYIDDIRFYPSDALVTTTYYDPFAGKPVAAVDFNSKCAGIIEYDGFGNAKQTLKRKQDGTTTLLSEREYKLQNDLTNNEIRVLSPNGGETIKKNISVPIKWISGTDIASVDIQVTSDNGTNWTALAMGVQRDGNNLWGNYSWIPTIAPGTQLKIKVKEATGTSQDISDKTFSIVDPDPSIAYSPSPADNATEQGYRPTLSWTGGGSGAMGYDLYLATVTPPQIKIADNITATTHQLTSDLFPNETYYWRVVAKNSISATEGPVWKFSTKTGTFPYVTPKSPKHATLCGLDKDAVKFEWQGDAETFDLFYWKEGTSIPSTAQDSNIPGTYKVVGGLDDMAVYNWKVCAKKTGYISHTSEVWGFRTGLRVNAVPPTVPNNLAGVWNSSTYSIKLSWSGGDPTGGELVAYRVLFNVQRFAAAAITKTTPRVYPTFWEVNCFDKFKEYLSTFYKASMTNLANLSTTATAFTAIEVLEKEVNIPCLDASETGDHITFYVQAFDYCNRKIYSESELKKISPPGF